MKLLREIQIPTLLTAVKMPGLQRRKASKSRSKDRLIHEDLTTIASLSKNQSPKKPKKIKKAAVTKDDETAAKNKGHLKLKQLIDEMFIKRVEHPREAIETAYQRREDFRNTLSELITQIPRNEVSQCSIDNIDYQCSVTNTSTYSVRLDQQIPAQNFTLQCIDHELNAPSSITYTIINSNEKLDLDSLTISYPNQTSIKYYRADNVSILIQNGHRIRVEAKEGKPVTPNGDRELNIDLNQLDPTSNPRKKSAQKTRGVDRTTIGDPTTESLIEHSIENGQLLHLA